VTVEITTWPAHTTEPVPVPLPRLGLCPDCADEIRLRGNGRLYAHHCTGDGSLPVIALKATFARWLWAQSRRRDDYTNLLTLFAGRIYRGCTRAPERHAGDMPWSSAEELHSHLHTVRLARGGRDGCDFMCRHLETAARHYGQLLAAAGIDDVGRDEKPGPTVRVHHNLVGWVLPDFTDFQPCTSNHHRAQDGRPACTAVAVWKVVEDHGMHLSIGFYCDTDLPDEHRARAGVAA